jgi:hypothetical protein
MKGKYPRNVKKLFYITFKAGRSGFSKRGDSIIGTTLDSTPPQARLRKTLERQPLINANQEEKRWDDVSVIRTIPHKFINKAAF